jgi:hypothetical protein
MLNKEPISQLRAIFYALANLTAYAVARLHDPLAMRRSPTIQALDNMLHAMLEIEATRKRVYNIMCLVV